MATITPYVAEGVHEGQKQSVKAQKFIWIPVGSGVITRFSNFEVALEGAIDILGYKGDLNIHLRLTDEVAGASSGSGLLRLNSHVYEQATYKVQGEALTIYAVLGGYKQNITVSRCNGGTQTECKLSGKVNETVHLEPQR